MAYEHRSFPESWRIFVHSSVIKRIYLFVLSRNAVDSSLTPWTRIALGPSCIVTLILILNEQLLLGGDKAYLASRATSDKTSRSVYCITPRSRLVISALSL